MKTKILISAIVLGLGVVGARAGQPDPRFEGVWVGQETYTVYASASQLASQPQHMPATIAIADGGKVFGVIQGLGPGKYETSSSSNGNKLVFKSHLTGTGRTSCTFVLSPDGNTITETGFGILPGYGHAVECSISGTLHRRAKK